ncbi:uncharacterized protein LOC123537259 [Mercenaria mercenaria]|uniref:uncharacterized protein LOC123537259 n=1 Tax=Mercenaria mercenaria TaxID=6596 RepID=UPI00234E9F6B|nr:uncharacterized protein LOC123537259 [Mercenaria mercenaria]
MDKRRKNKNSSLRRRKVDKFQNKDHVNTPKQNIKCGTIDTITVSVEEDQESVVLSLKTIADRFTDGCILFDYGKLTVYLNVRADLLADIENTSVANQMDFSLLHDVYNSYKTFLLYSNKDGKKKILPKNMYFQTIIERIEKGVFDNGNVSSHVFVLLRELTNSKQECKSKLNEDTNNDSECCTKNKSATQLQAYRQKQSHYHKEIINKTTTELNCRRNVSLQSSKICLGNVKVIKPLLKHVPSLPRLPSPIPRLKIFSCFPFEEQLHYPNTASEEQRDDEQIHSAQVVSNVNSVVHGERLSSHQQDASNGFYSPVTSHAQSDIRGTERPVQQRPQVPPRHPNYSHYAERLMSFTEWKHRSPQPETLSQAGFFFTKQGDLVRCFQCGIGLKDFSLDDDPLLEHVRHSRQCPFLPELLGDDGLAMYQNRLQAVDPEYNRQQQWAETERFSNTIKLLPS